MAISYPRSMPDRGVAQQSFELERADYISPTLSGAVGAVAAGWPLWSAEWSFSETTEERTQEWRAWVSSLRGSQRLFFGFDRMRRLPLKHRVTGLEGSGNASSWAVNSTRDVVTLAGMHSSLALSPGDYLGFEWGTNRCTMVRVLEAASGSSPVVSVEPPVPVLVPGSAVATVKNPRCLMRLTPETELGQIGVERSLSGTLKAIQSLIP